jgi:DNA-directed RNA polymerase subunit RPC12/RpoP/nucleoid DNA-binding protein
MKDTYTKQKLIAEIVGATAVSKAEVMAVLGQLARIAYREAANGFVVPGICKLKVITKKACRRRNPITGQILLIGERRAVKIVPLKKAKDIIAPNAGVGVQVLDAPPPAAPEILEEAGAAPAPPAATSSPVTPPPPPSRPRDAVPEKPVEKSADGQIVFSCPECSTILSSPPDSSGRKGECPFCKGSIVVPACRTDDQPQRKAIAGDAPPQSLSDFILFSCRACGQQIEAPADMVGMDVECPTCGTKLTVPIAETGKPVVTQPAAPAPQKPTIDRSAMTIRINLSELP